jgi:hypothetical protein
MTQVGNPKKTFSSPNSETLNNSNSSSEPLSTAFRLANSTQYVMGLTIPSPSSILSPAAESQGGPGSSGPHPTFFNSRRRKETPFSSNLTSNKSTFQKSTARKNPCTTTRDSAHLSDPTSSSATIAISITKAEAPFLHSTTVQATHTKQTRRTRQYCADARKTTSESNSMKYSK